MLINEAFCKSSYSTCPSNEPSTFNFLSSTWFLNGKVTVRAFVLENQLFMLTGVLVLFAFSPQLLGQVHSWATLPLRDECWLQIRASRPLSSQNDTVLLGQGPHPGFRFTECTCWMARLENV